jgi:hypothetical protein
MQLTTALARCAMQQSNSPKERHKMKYYTFTLKLEPEQIRKMQDAWDDCIGCDPTGSGLFCFISFKTETLRGMIMPPDIRQAFKPHLDGVLAASQKDDLGTL